MFGFAQRCRFRVDGTALFADIGRFKDGKAFGVGRHDAVFDAVVHHLDEMAGAVRTAVQIAVLGSSVHRAARGAWDVATGRRQGGKDRVEMFDDPSFAADHHAVAAFQPPDTAAGADVDIVDALGRQLLGAANVVDVI